MIVCAGSMPSHCSDYRDIRKRVVEILATEQNGGRRYNRDMTKTAANRARPVSAINQWVLDALKHANMSQSKLAAALYERKIISANDRSIVNKMTIGRDVTANEVFAIADITGFPAPNETDDLPPIREEAEILRILQRIEGLNPNNITVLLSTIADFRKINMERSSHNLHDDQSSIATPRRESQS